MKHCILNGVNEKMQLQKFKLEEEYFSISNVYAPIDDKEKVKFFNTLSNVIMRNVDISKEKVIVCGDMNSVMDNNMDIISGEKHDGNVVKALISMFHKCALIDTWRNFDAGEKEFTWKQRNNPFIARRLDYIIINEIMLNKISMCKINPFHRSDHYAVDIMFSFSTIAKGKGY